MNGAKKSAIKRLIFRIVAVISCCSLLMYLARREGPALWSNLHLINFVVAWIPAVLSILVAFVPDKELETRMRVSWRCAVIACGVLYSITLWHQQSLVDKSNLDSNARLLNDAVAKANEHADLKFDRVQQRVEGLGGKVDGLSGKVDDVGKNLGAAVSDDLEKATQDLGTKIGEVGKPLPPATAKLVPTLWGQNTGVNEPQYTAVVHADSSGAYPVEFTYINTSDVTAEGVDIWVEVCRGCSFASEPAGFEKPSGSDEHVRHRILGNLNPGVSFEKIIVNVKYPQSQSFKLAFRYSCKTCGRMQPGTEATIIPLSNTNLPQEFHEIRPAKR